MAEPRARIHHRNRVAGTLRDEISTMIEGELSDPRLGTCYVTEVVMNPASKSARVYVAVDGEEAEEKNTIDALVAAKGYIRHELQERLGVRRVPDLTFHVDRSERFQSRIDDLLGRVQRRQKSVEAKAAASAPKVIPEKPPEA